MSRAREARGLLTGWGVKAPASVGYSIDFTVLWDTIRGDGVKTPDWIQSREMDFWQKGCLYFLHS